MCHQIIRVLCKSCGMQLGGEEIRPMPCTPTATRPAWGSSAPRVAHRAKRYRRTVGLCGLCRAAGAASPTEGSMISRSGSGSGSGGGSGGGDADFDGPEMVTYRTRAAVEGKTEGGQENQGEMKAQARTSSPEAASNGDEDHGTAFGTAIVFGGERGKV